jgi:hypothetical protein
MKLSYQKPSFIQMGLVHEAVLEYEILSDGHRYFKI